MLSLQTLKFLKIPIQFGNLFFLLPFKWSNKSKCYISLPQRKLYKCKFYFYPWKIILSLLMLGQTIVGIYFIIFLFIFSKTLVDILLTLFALSIIGFSLIIETLFLYKSGDLLYCFNSLIKLNEKLGSTMRQIDNADGIEHLILANCIIPICVQIFVFPAMIKLFYDEFNILKHFLFIFQWLPKCRELMSLTVTIATAFDWIYIVIATSQAISCLHIINRWIKYQISNLSEYFLIPKDKRNLRIGYRTLQIFHKLLIDTVYYVLPIIFLSGSGLLLSILYSLIRFRNSVGPFVYTVFGLVGILVCLIFLTAISFAVKINILSKHLPEAYLSRYHRKYNVLLMNACQPLHWSIGTIYTFKRDSLLTFTQNIIVLPLVNLLLTFN